MKLSVFENLLKGKTLAKDFLKYISNDVESYKKGLGKVGASIILNIEDDTDFYLTKGKLKFLLKLYLSKDITGIELSYIADCLTMSDKTSFESEAVRDIVEGLTEIDFNNSVATKEVRQFIDSLT
jgi:hypothetical protein